MVFTHYIEEVFHVKNSSACVIDFNYDVVFNFPPIVSPFLKFPFFLSSFLLFSLCEPYLSLEKWQLTSICSLSNNLLQFVCNHDFFSFLSHDLLFLIQPSFSIIYHFLYNHYFPQKKKKTSSTFLNLIVFSP